MASPEPEAEAVPRAEADQLDLAVLPECKTVLCRARNTVRTLICIKTPPLASSASRAPIEVACVLDRSGSMRGAKLAFAKRACAKLVKHLDVQDTLHFIAYDQESQTIFTDGDLSEIGKENLKTQIHAVRPGGATNLFGGLQSAAHLLLGSSAGTPDEAKVKRIFLFSDGCVNSGVTDPAHICREVAAWTELGITTATFGIGADFDEPLMRGIAEAGKGRYTFLATAPDIPRLVSKSIHDLLKLFGSEAVLDIRGGMHTVVDKAYGGDDEDEEVSNASAGLLHLGDLHADNERMVLLELTSSPPGDFGPGRSIKAAEWMLSYLRNGATVQFSGTLELTTTADRGRAQEHPAVKAMFTLRRAADLEREVAEHLQQRNLIAARDVKTQQLLLLSQALSSLEGVEESYVLALQRAYQRAQRVAEQLQTSEDMELTRRQCVHECDRMDAMSLGGFSDGRDSSVCSDIADNEDAFSTGSAGSVASILSIDSYSPREARIPQPQDSQAQESRELTRRVSQGYMSRFWRWCSEQPCGCFHIRSLPYRPVPNVSSTDAPDPEEPR